MLVQFIMEERSYVFTSVYVGTGFPGRQVGHLRESLGSRFVVCGNLQASLVCKCNLNMMNWYANYLLTRQRSLNPRFGRGVHVLHHAYCSGHKSGVGRSLVIHWLLSLSFDNVRWPKYRSSSCTRIWGCFLRLWKKWRTNVDTMNSMIQGWQSTVAIV